MIDLIIRADANATIGTGHLMRCLALAQAHREYGGHATFLMAPESDAISPRISSAGVKMRHLRAANRTLTDLEETLGVLREYGRPGHPGNGPWLVLDGYHFDDAYHQAIRTEGYRLLVIDDTAHLPCYHANILLNQNLAAEALEYRRDPDTRLLLGTRYALLRPEFAAFCEWKREIPRVARKLLITLGGADPANITVKVIDALENVQVDDLDVVVVCGAANPHRKAIEAVSQRSSREVRIVQAPTDMAQLMAWADVAVTASGSTCWELAFMCLPSIIIVLAPNQRVVGQELVRCGAALDGGSSDTLEPYQLGRDLTALCEDEGRRRLLAKRGRQLVDGRGAHRVVQALGTVRMESGAPSLRPARAEDALSLWHLANDPTVRTNAFETRPIPLDCHLRWFDEKLGSSDSRLWVLVTRQDDVVGQIRYDRTEHDVGQIDFAVHSDFRGQSLGTSLLATWEAACKELRLKRVRGVVKKTNEPSARAFIKAGFQPIGEGVIASHSCQTFERACGGRT